MSDARQRPGLKDLGELLLARLFRFLPIDWVSAIGAWLGRRHGRRAIAAKRLWVGRMHVSLERLWGMDDPKARERWIIAHTSHTGRVYAEIPILHRMVRAGRLEIVGGEHLENLSSPVIIATCHLGNWELIGRVAEMIGGRLSDIYLPLGAGVRAILAHEARALWRFEGGRSADLVPATTSALRQISRAIAGGSNLMLFIDEEKSGYVWAPSLGRDIPYQGNRWFAARLAVRYGADILPAYIEPDGPGRYRAVIEPKLAPPQTGSDDDKARYLADKLDERVDAWVRQLPEYWYWLPQLDLDKAPPSYSIARDETNTQGGGSS